MASADTVFDPVRTFEATGDWQSVAVSRGGRQVLGAFEGGPVTLWDVQTGHVLRTFEGGTAPVAFSPAAILTMGFCAHAKIAKLAKGETCRAFAGSAGFAGDGPGGSQLAEEAMG
jgi:hypothetical protein